MTKLCDCGVFHYTLDSFFKIHGDYLGSVKEHKKEVALFPNGKIADLSKLKMSEEVPIITYKMICRYCGNFNTTSSFDTHKINCSFITYLKLRDTVPYNKVKNN